MVKDNLLNIFNAKCSICGLEIRFHTAYELDRCQKKLDELREKDQYGRGTG